MQVKAQTADWTEWLGRSFNRLQWGTFFHTLHFFFFLPTLWCLKDWQPPAFWVPLKHRELVPSHKQAFWGVGDQQQVWKCYIFLLHTKVGRNSLVNWQRVSGSFCVLVVCPVWVPVVVCLGSKPTVLQEPHSTHFQMFFIPSSTGADSNVLLYKIGAKGSFAWLENFKWRNYTLGTFNSFIDELQPLCFVHIDSYLKIFSPVWTVHSVNLQTVADKRLWGAAAK